MRDNIYQPDTTKLAAEIPTQDRLLDDIFPIRTKLDVSVRRLKFLDLYRVASPELKFEMRHYTHLDIIFATNVLCYGIIHGHTVLADLRQLGVFNSFDHFAEVSSTTSSYFKRVPFDLDDSKQRLCEIGSLIGYLQNDTETWDTKQELKGLAEGGNEHGTDPANWMPEFERLMRKIQEEAPNTRPKFITFKEFVMSSEWITSGSSSIGKVNWTYEDDSGKFKARKNMLEDIYTPEELWEIVNSWDGVLRSRAFIKDEVGKRRLAVASNIEAYLHEAYILRLYGHGFKAWSGITLDESPKAQHIRNAKCMKLLSDGAYALPFDFRRFDHQPTTLEIQTMVADLASQIRVPAANQAEWTGLVNKVIQSYSKSEITMQVGAEHLKEQVKGGIPSGVRITSLIGNEWNSIMTEKAIQLATEILSYNPVLMRMIKGDDTGIITTTPVEAFIIRLCYQAINAIGLDSKFGISQNICEFLRNEISPTGVRGWSNRAIPTITQRKPWNPEPWSPSSSVSTVASNIYLLERRLRRECPELHRANKIKWSKFTNQSQLWLELPTRMGGFGLYPWRGWEPNCKLPLVTKPLIRVDGLAPMQPFSWIELNGTQLESVHQQQMSNKISTADINGPQKYFSRDYITRLRKLKPSWTQSPVPSVPVKYINDPGVTTNPYWPKDPNHYMPSADPAMPDLALWLRQYDTIKKAAQYDKSIKLDSLKHYLQQFYPNAHSNLVNYERAGWHRTDALNLCMNIIPTEPVKQLHPLLTIFVKDAIDRLGCRYWRGRKNIALKLYNATTGIVERLMHTSTADMYSF